MEFVLNNDFLYRTFHFPAVVVMFTYFNNCLFDKPYIESGMSLYSFDVLFMYLKLYTVSFLQCFL